MNRIHTKYYNYNDNYICVYYTNTLSVYNACVPNAQVLYSLMDSDCLFFSIEIQVSFY